MRVGVGGATNHRRFGLEVSFGGGGTIVLVGSEKIGEEAGGAGGGVSHGGVVCADGVGIVIGIVAVTGGLEGSDLGFGGGGGTMSPNGSRCTEREACEDANDGDDGENFDQSECGPALVILGKPC